MTLHDKFLFHVHFVCAAKCQLVFMSKVLSCCFRRTHNFRANNKNTLNDSEELQDEHEFRAKKRERKSLRRKTLEIIKSRGFYGEELISKFLRLWV